MEKLKYIDNEPNNGIKYDWKKIMATYRKLGIPPEYDYSEIVPFENDKLKWYNLNGRDLPWRVKGGAHPNPYVILVSELNTDVIPKVLFFPATI